MHHGAGLDDGTLADGRAGKKGHVRAKPEAVADSYSLVYTRVVVWDRLTLVIVVAREDLQPLARVNPAANRH